MVKGSIISTVAACLMMSVTVNADETKERIEALESQVEALKEELTSLKDHADEEEDDDEDDEDEDDDEDEIEESLEYFDKAISKLNRNTAGNHLKFGVDFRTTYDNIQYKMAGKDQNGDDTKSNDALFSNRLWLNMNWLANQHISFTGQLAYYKTYGARFGVGNPAFENFDWIVNENPYDDTVRVRSAYFFYRDSTFFGLVDIPWTFSIGRRPSTNGHIIHLREDDRSASPMGHSINVEFDGLSSKFSFENLTGIDGMYVKFCAGRGGSNADAKFAPAPFASDNVSNIDLAGAIFVPYDDGQYEIGTQYYYAGNLIDATFAPNPASAPSFTGMKDVGSMQSFTAHFMISGIGDDWSGFLDDTMLFASGAMSITNPDQGEYMLGSKDSETGSSYWVGTQFPSLISSEGRWGLEFNHGDKYWRSITYGEDTMIGSKVAARGNAYEAYFTEPLIGDALSFQLRYTYIDYEYTGSNGFFGGNPTNPMDGTGTSMNIEDVKGTPMASQVVDTAQDIRAYIRYRF